MEEFKLIDDAFYVKETSWGTWKSFDMENKCIITSLTMDLCINSTRFYLKGKQEGFPEVKKYGGIVDGKL